MFKDILTLVFSATSDEPALRASEIVAATDEADLAALLLNILPDPAFGPGGGVVETLWADVLATAHKQFAQEKAALEARNGRSERRFVLRDLMATPAIVAQDAAVQARHADLTVMMRPGGVWPEDWRESVFESVLFGSGRPLLLVPPDWKGRTIGRSILVAWDGKREAARALADAAPFLTRAERVTLATVDAKPSAAGHGPAPGVDIAAHLARRDVSVELRNLDGVGRSETDTLLAEARNVEADLIVMGGYGRARIREWVFGGVTREMLTDAHAPVFMAH